MNSTILHVDSIAKYVLPDTKVFQSSVVYSLFNIQDARYIIVNLFQYIDCTDCTFQRTSPYYGGLLCTLYKNTERKHFALKPVNIVLNTTPSCITKGTNIKINENH